ncbi:hypothetical protein B0H15DRAFT_833626 [Mycena belliarum]|uniref:Secreted protein n=1 Tax=Mycena belliarum TaxID=1033014 RepID=A0AAD6XSK9_9AGAR|nr:hypothetical protein B0H15DRAFT_833626 [Mycena belliae]
MSFLPRLVRTHIVSFSLSLALVVDAWMRACSTGSAETIRSARVALFPRLHLVSCSPFGNAVSSVGCRRWWMSRLGEWQSSSQLRSD